MTGNTSLDKASFQIRIQKFDFETGLRNTIEWFSDPVNLAKYKSDIYNI